MQFGTRCPLSLPLAVKCLPQSSGWIDTLWQDSILSPWCVPPGEINGGFFGTLGQMVQMYEAQGADFSGCETAEEKLEVIEAFEDAMNAPSDEPTTDERIAAALEYQVMASLPDVEEV